MPSIEANILGPARTAGKTQIYAHFFRQRSIADARTGESGQLDVEEHRLLRPDWLELEEPDLCLETWDFEGLKRHGDFWQNNFLSLRNLVHQLHSLNRVTEAALADGAKICLFLRPDLRYHDSLVSAVTRAAAAARADKALVQLPRWQPWGGRNDRFAVAAGPAAIAAYGQRVTRLIEFCIATGGPVHSEQLVAYALDRAGISVRTIAARASRVRLGGGERYEDFLPPRLSTLRRNVRASIFRLLGRDPGERFRGGHGTQ